MPAVSRRCVIYVKNGREHRTAWFTSMERTQRALILMRARHGAAIIFHD